MSFKLNCIIKHTVVKFVTGMLTKAESIMFDL